MSEIEQIAPVVHRNLPRGIHSGAAPDTHVAKAR